MPIDVPYVGHSRRQRGYPTILRMARFLLSGLKGTSFRSSGHRLSSYLHDRPKCDLRRHLLHQVLECC